MNKSYKYLRWWNCIKAFFGGYFWLSCPRCSKNFGGHEWIHPDQSLGNSGICLECYEICKQNGEIERDIQKTVKEVQQWHKEYTHPQEDR